MKKNVFILIGLMLMLLATSCTDDVGDLEPTVPIVPDPEFYFEYNGTKYEIDTAYDSYDYVSSIMINELYLFSEDFYWSSWMHCFMGSGDGIYIEVVSDQMSCVPVGNYVTTDTNYLLSGYIYDIRVKFGYDPFSFSSDSTFVFENGNLSITNDNAGVYTLDGDFTTSNGKTAKVYYEGGVKRVDESFKAD